MAALASAPVETSRTAALFHALSDETRLRILQCLAACEQCVCDLGGLVGAAQSRLSFHLKVLKEVGLIVDSRRGRWNYYALVPGALEEAIGTLSELKDRSRSCSDSGGCC